MKKRFLFYLFLAFAFPLFSQYLETQLFIPDSFSGLPVPSKMVWDSIHDLLYLKGHGDRILVLDCERDEKLPPIEIVRGEHQPCENIFYNPINNCLYAIYRFPPFQNDTLFIVNCATHQVLRKIKLPYGWGYSAFALNTRENKVYLSLSSNDTAFFVIDGETHQVLHRSPVPMWGWSAMRTPFLWNPRNNKIYYIPYQNSNIYILNALTGIIEDSVNAHPRFPFSDLVPNERWDRLYIPARDSFYNPNDFVLILDCETNQIVGEVSLGNFSAVGTYQYNPVNNKLYLISYPEDGQLKVIDLNNLQVDTIAFPGLAPLTTIKYALPHNVLYCFGRNDSAVAILDGATNQIVGRIEINYNGDPCPGDPSFYHPLRDKLYFANQILGIIDCARGEQIKEMYLGTWDPYDLVLNPLTHKLYATEVAFPIITVFDVKKKQTFGLC